MAEPAISIILNRPDGSLPYGLYDPKTSGRLIWMCNKTPEKKIIGVFKNSDPSDPGVMEQEINSLSQAKYFRDELIKAGWKPLMKNAKVVINK
jgi:hypothetical protein